MSSAKGKPLTPEVKKLIVSIKHYFARNHKKIGKSGNGCTAEAAGIGVATVKRITADCNLNPDLLDKTVSVRGRRSYVINISHQEQVQKYVRKANQKGAHIALETIQKFLLEIKNSSLI